ncbi:S-adenosylmethionine:tRNA ribosyltransferase-isomerase, partial [bacterium]|nr:S-adenosylmethionine:tRNA ribosyltransferase-isomerase [bacterium]
MRLSDFNYDLPEELIAQFPPRERGLSRLLVLHRHTSQIEHKRFDDLPEYLRRGDCLVLNETRVLPARLLGVREKSGGKIELLLVRDLGDGRWQFLVRPSRKAKPGAIFLFGKGRLRCEVEERVGSGAWVGNFQGQGDLDTLL